MAENVRKASSQDGTVLAYREYGNGPRLLTCLHSLALDGSWFEPFAAALGDTYRVLAPDFRGHGHTPRGDADISLGLVAQDVAAMWAAENVDHSVVLGISLGGMVAQAVTGSFPDHVDAQILIATRGAYDETATRGTLARAADVRAPQGLAGAADSTMVRWFGDAAAEPDNDLVRRGREQFVGAGGETIADYFTAMTGVGDFGTPTPPPTLVVGGDDDRSTPAAVVEQLAAAIPGAQLRVAHGGHLLAFENPHEAAATVLPFLNNLDCWPR